MYFQAKNKEIIFIVIIGKNYKREYSFEGYGKNKRIIPNHHFHSQKNEHPKLKCF